MARGWESKAVEDQQRDAETRAAGATTAGSGAGGVDPTREAQKQALLLARARALADLQLACRPAHRAMLEGAIADLDARLSVLY